MDLERRRQPGLGEVDLLDGGADVSGLTHYVFRSVWHIPASMADVVPVLEDLGSYPAWWPEIREVHPLGNDRFEVVARSLLPYELGSSASPTTTTRPLGSCPPACPAIWKAP